MIVYYSTTLWLGNYKHESVTINKPSKNKNMEISILILVLIIFLFNRYLSNGTNIKLHEDDFDISGIYGLTISYEDIYLIDIISNMPEIGVRTYGFYFMSICKGYFNIKDVGNAYLNLNLKHPPYIKIILKNDYYIFINLSTEKDTKELFDNLVHMTLKNK
jgi:hypothetical protein